MELEQNEGSQAINDGQGRMVVARKGVMAAMELHKYILDSNIASN